jgi:hypothetical protein
MIYKTLISILAISLFVFASNRFTDNDTVSYLEDSVILDSSFGPAKGIKSVLTQQRIVNYYSHENYLFKSIKNKKEYANVEGSHCELLIVAFKKADKNKYKEIWKITNHDCASGVDSSRCFYTTTCYGCCGAEDVISYFSIETGIFIAKGTSGAISIPGAGYSIVYFGNQGTSYKNKDTSISGIIYLVKDNKILDNINVKYVKGPTWTPDINVDIANYNPPKGFKIIIKFEEESYYLFIKNNSILIPKEFNKVFYK